MPLENALPHAKELETRVASQGLYIRLASIRDLAASSRMCVFSNAWWVALPTHILATGRENGILAARRILIVLPEISTGYLQGA